MELTRKQQTIAATAVVKGVGYWSSRDVRVEFRPADPDTGLVFVRDDLPGCPRIPATIAHRTDCPLRTNLRAGQAGVDMVEHVMAALAGMQIDNCEIRVNQAEMPGCDGSSLPFVTALRRPASSNKRHAARCERSVAWSASATSGVGSRPGRRPPAG